MIQSKKIVYAFIIEQIRLATKSEKEVERFLKVLLPGTPFAGKTKAVGGYVRDEYLRLIKNDPSIEAKDLDIVVEMDGGAQKITEYIYDVFNTLWPKMERFFTGLKKSPVSKPRQMGKGYPIWQITFKDDITYKGEKYNTKDAVIEFADTMTESFPSEGSRQRETKYGPLEKDIERRDFTVNMLMKDLTTGEIEDFTGVSKEDISKGILRGHPKVSLDKIFKDDPLRMLRLIRFQAKYDWKIPDYVRRTVKRNANRINIISKERIHDELIKIFKYGKTKNAIQLMSAMGLLKHILPEVEVLKGVKQPPEHHAEGDVYRHTLKVLKETGPGIDKQLAALLHDIGKPKTQNFLKDKITFYGHHDAGAEIAGAIMKRLKFDKKTQERVKNMVQYHMRPHRLPKDPSDKALRRFIRDIGDELVDAVLDLADADAIGRIPSKSTIPELREKIKNLQKEKPMPKKPVLNGNEIKEILNLKTGPAVGVAKKMLEEKSFDDPNITKEKAEEFLKKNKEKIVEKAEKQVKKVTAMIIQSTKEPGEKLISGDGYYMIKPPKDYKGTKYIDGRYIYEHRYIMEKKLGRPLKYNENIDHIDGNKLNNDPDNLRLMSRKEHTKHTKPAKKGKKNMKRKSFLPHIEPPPKASPGAWRTMKILDKRNPTPDNPQFIMTIEKKDISNWKEIAKNEPVDVVENANKYIKTAPAKPGLIAIGSPLKGFFQKAQKMGLIGKYASIGDFLKILAMRIDNSI